ncbi:MAG TPA: hypothetical protein PK170_02310 [Anaerolineae bacterium]|nr:hypothetical protein [Anaerolineae bacterium]
MTSILSLILIEGGVMTAAYPWYSLVEDRSLEQGDFLFLCRVLEPMAPDVLTPDTEFVIKAIDREYDVLILSQSCDLVQGKIETVLVCPHWPIEILEEQHEFFRSRRGKEDVRRGNVPGYHMLAACELPGYVSPVRVVSFRQVFGLPFGYVVGLVHRQSPRLRLNPPYREHLGQAFARFVMRVGLPVDIPSCK